MIHTKKISKAILTTTLVIALTGCSTFVTTKNNRDPYESYNKKIFAFNDKVYKVLTPLADVYQDIVPNFVQDGIVNFFQNLREPARVANDLLQGNVDYAGDDSARFLINTTLGIGGIFDVANSWFGEKVRSNQSFAATLRKWGVYSDDETSPYIVWPFAGPGTLDGVASAGFNAIFNPLTYVFFFAPVSSAVSNSVSFGTTGAYYVNQTASAIPAYENLKEVSLDPYIATRNAYLQNYDYGINKVLGRDTTQKSGDSDSDKAVLGVLGLDNNNQTKVNGDSQNKNTTIAKK